MCEIDDQINWSSALLLFPPSPWRVICHENGGAFVLTVSLSAGRQQSCWPFLIIDLSGPFLPVCVCVRCAGLILLPAN